MANLIKFLRSADRRFIEDDETIAVSSSRYFSRNFSSLEGSDPAIFDAYEGSILHNHDPIEGIGLSERNRHILAEMGITGIDNKTIVHASGNVSVRRTREFFMFCLAVGDKNILQAKFNDRPNISSEDMYDCAFRIRYFDSFAFALWELGHIESLDARVKDVFNRPSSGPVTYGSVLNNLSREPKRRPSPYFKRSDLSWQCEFRLVLTPLAPHAIGDRLIIKIPDLGRYISWNF